MRSGSRSPASFHDSPKMGEYSSVSMQFPSGQASAPPWPASPPPPSSQASASHSPAAAGAGSGSSSGSRSAAPFSIPGVRITSVLGRGGFATVYAGVQDSLERPVAVKVDSRPLDDPRNERRFMREVQAASRISGHPHVVSLVDTGKLPDLRPYLVMELCAGGSLYDLVSRGPTPASDAVALVEAAASALGAAHAAGVTHRDVKPANILLDSYGSPRLSDFGIAAVQREGQDPTVTLECLTPDFAAPEAFMLASPGPEGDVWSMGAVLFSLLTGRGPRRGPDGVQRSLPEIVRSLDAPLNLSDPNVPEILLPVLSKAMAPDPADRYRNGTELTGALGQVREQLGTGDLAVGGPVTSLQLVEAGLAPPPGRNVSAQSARSAQSAPSSLSGQLEYYEQSSMPVSSPDSLNASLSGAGVTGAGRSIRITKRERRQIGLRAGIVGAVVGLVIGLVAGWMAGTWLAPAVSTARTGASAGPRERRQALGRPTPHHRARTPRPRRIRSVPVWPAPHPSRGRPRPGRWTATSPIPGRSMRWGRWRRAPRAPVTTIWPPIPTCRTPAPRRPPSSTARPIRAHRCWARARRVGTPGGVVSHASPRT